MEKDIEQVQIEFNEGANTIFFSLYQRFADAARPIDRRKEDNVFQQMNGKYLYTLKEQLDALAKKLIHKYSSIPNSNKLEKTLTEGIRLYTNEFRRKMGLL